MKIENGQIPAAENDFMSAAFVRTDMNKFGVSVMVAPKVMLDQHMGLVIELLQAMETGSSNPEHARPAVVHFGNSPPEDVVKRAFDIVDAVLVEGAKRKWIVLLDETARSELRAMQPEASFPSPGR